MKFGHTLARSLVPEWTHQYINYDGLKQRLKQVQGTQHDFPETVQPPSTSLSIPRSLSQPGAALLQQLLDQEQQQQEQEQQQEEQQQRQQPADTTALLLPPGSPSMRVAQALQLDSGPAEQFLQLLQQELNKVRAFIRSQGGQLQAELQALAAAAPQLSLADYAQLEARAHELGRQLLALEGFMQLNQAGFVKIVKKHDKWLPQEPIWHLYLHHLQRSPLLDEAQRQLMWAALSSCYYHLHAASIYSSRARSSQQKQARAPSPAPASQQTSPQPTPRDPGGSSGKRVVGGLTTALGSAVAGAASAVAGAATVAAALAGAAGGPAALSAAAAAGSEAAADQQPEVVAVTHKFWVRECDVPAVMYFILQHLPLLPSTVHHAASATSSTSGAGQAQEVVAAGQQPIRRQQQQQQQEAGSSSRQQRQPAPQLLLQPALAGFTTTLHTVYFDNVALELYHGRLYLRPRTQTLKARWIGQAGASSGSGRSEADQEQGLPPEKVVLERKIYREGWRGEPNTKDSLLIAGDKLPLYLAGSYTLGDALADLCEVPACKAQLLQASGSVSQQQQQQQRLLASPFAQAQASTAAAVTTTTPAIDIAAPGAAADAAAAAAEVEEAEAEAALAASVRLPRGFAIGSFSSRSLGHAGSAGGSHPSLLQLLEREKQQQQQAAVFSPDPAAPPAQPPPPAAAQDDQLQSGFADDYLDPPMPTADQLSLFTEVQSLVGRKRLRPVLHCMLHRMVFAMPFDNSVRITLDTDVRTTALGHTQPLTPADWRHQQQQQLSLSFSRSESLPAARLWEAEASQALSAAGSSNPPHLQQQQQQQQQQHTAKLPPRPSINGGTTSSSQLLPQLHASTAAWDAVFGAHAFSRGHRRTQHGTSRQPNSPTRLARASSSSRHGGDADADADADAIVHRTPYALLKVTCRLSAEQSTPGWLQQLMESEAVTPVEDWSKFIHGCAVLLPDTVRAVPYWMDDGLVETSVAALQSQLEAEEARRDQARLRSLRRSSGAASNASSTSASGLPIDRGSSAGGNDGAAAAAQSGASAPDQQQQQPMLQRLAGSFRSMLGRTSSSSAAAADSDGWLQSDSFTASLQQIGQQQAAAGAGSVRRSSSSAQHGARCSTAGMRVSWADGDPQQASVAAAAAAAGGHEAVGLRLRLRRLLRKDRPPPLFRQDNINSSSRRPHRFHPVQLLESREFFYSEAVFMSWLNLAITLASVAVLLMGYSSMAYVNPLKRPTMHVAEIICLLMLPCSCVIVGYAIRSYVWRRRRLHSMRYSRVDDPVGALAMTLVFVASMTAIMLVNIADIFLLLKAAARDDPSGGGGDDPSGGGGGDDPPPSGLVGHGSGRVLLAASRISRALLH